MRYRRCSGSCTSPGRGRSSITLLQCRGRNNLLARTAKNGESRPHVRAQRKPKGWVGGNDAERIHTRRQVAPQVGSGTAAVEFLSGLRCRAT
jgi:hypothetical protein